MAKKRASKKVDETPAEIIPERCVVATRAEAAAELKRRIGKGSVRTLADWFKQGCPNDPGAYDVDAIEAWVLENIGVGDEYHDVAEVGTELAYWKLVKLREQALKAQGERLMLEGKLCDTDEISRLVERLAGTLLSMLGQWPDWVLTLLPADVKPGLKKTIRDKVGAKVEDLGNTVADMLNEWAGQTPEVEDEEV